MVIVYGYAQPPVMVSNYFYGMRNTLMVYVIAKDNSPLMPTENHAKVRVLLKTGRAKVLKKTPFTIRLLYDTGHGVQETTHGIDTGSAHIGSSVYANGKIVYTSQIEIRNDIKGLMDARRKYRRTRRARKTRYRKPRFLNRSNSTRLDRLSPTIQSKLACHEREIRYVAKILPISKLVLETGTFDPHLLKNPELANPIYRHWGYQKGTNYGFYNTKAYILARDNYTCQCCKGKHKDSKLEVHHIIFRSNGGSDDSNNLITLCHTCHKALHDGRLKKFKPQGMIKNNLLHATQMNILRNQLLKAHQEAIETFGYTTKADREHLNIPKDHYTDACVIASEGKPFNMGNMVQLIIKKCSYHHDYQKTKGLRSEQHLNTDKICGFRKFDKVRYFGNNYFIKGRMSTGYATLMDIFGNKIDFSQMPKGFKTTKLANCKRLEARKSWMVTTLEVIPNIV